MAKKRKIKTIPKPVGVSKTAFKAKYDLKTSNYLKNLYEGGKGVVPRKTMKIVKSAGKFLGNRALGVLGLIGGGTLSASATPTDEQKGVNKKQNVDFKAINKDLAKSMYKPLTKKKKGGKKYRSGGFKDTFLEPRIESLD